MPARGEQRARIRVGKNQNHTRTHRATMEDTKNTLTKLVLLDRSASFALVGRRSRFESSRAAPTASTLQRALS